TGELHSGSFLNRLFDKPRVAGRGRHGEAKQERKRAMHPGVILPAAAGDDIMSLMKRLIFLLALPLAASTVRIYVANSAGNDVTIIDPSANKAVGSIQVSNNPHGIVPSPDLNRFYVSSETDNVLDVVERSSGKVIRRVPIGKRPNNLAITHDGRRVYICIREESWVDIVDTTS